MIGIKKLLDMVATDAVEREGVPEDEWEALGPSMEPRPNYDNSLPPIRFNLELIRDSYGNLVWVE